MGRQNCKNSTKYPNKYINQERLNLCHYPTKIKALKLSWIKRLCNESATKFYSLRKYFYNCNDLNLYFSANHTFLKTIKNIPPFTRTSITYI